MSLRNLTRINIVDPGSRSPEIKLAIFCQFCATLQIHSLSYLHLASNILLGDKTSSDHEPYSFWYILDNFQGHQAVTNSQNWPFLCRSYKLLSSSSSCVFTID